MGGNQLPSINKVLEALRREFEENGNNWEWTGKYLTHRIEEATGLSKVTVSRVVRTLQSLGVLSEAVRVAQKTERGFGAQPTAKFRLLKPAAEIEQVDGLYRVKGESTPK